MASQYEDVILPDRPLYLVNRDWRISSRKSRANSNEASIKPSGGHRHSFKAIDPSRCTKAVEQQPRLLQKDATFVSVFPSTPPRDECRPRKTQNQNSSTIRGKGENMKWRLKTAAQQSPESQSSSDDTTDSELMMQMLEEAILASDCVRVGTQSASTPYMSPALFTLSTFKLPAFITQSHYLTYYVERVGQVMYPLTGLYTYNPLRDVWLPGILSDEMWFYTILYSVARHFAAHLRHSPESQLSRDATVLASMVIPRLRKTIEEHTKGTKPNDVALAAIACMAAIEHGFGTRKVFDQHIRGLSELIKAKGGVDQIDRGLRTKICRADLEGAVDNLTVPKLPPPRENPPSAFPAKLKPGVDFLLHPTYATVLAHLSLPLATVTAKVHSLVVFLNDETKNKRLLDPFTLDNDVLCLNHELCSIDQTNLMDLDEAFRIASLIFLKGLMRPFDVMPMTSTIMVTKLHKHLRTIPNPPEPLMTWLLFMGMLAGRWMSAERFWITERIISVTRTGEGQVPAWPEIRSRLQQIFWIDEIFDRVGERLWLEVEALAKL